MSFRGEGSAGKNRRDPFSPCRQKGFFVRSSRPCTGARNARRRVTHHSDSLLALLVCSAEGLCPQARLAQAGELPVYETVVVAPPAVVEAPREDRAASASVITQDRTPRAAESVPQLLSEQAGVTVTRLGGMGSTSTVSLRGSTSNQVLVYVDGVPFNTATGGGVDLGAIPLGDVDRIEIYRGMSPIGFGASGIGGVVSITTAVPKDNRVELEAGGGSFGTAYGDARAAWNHGRFHLYSGVHVLTSDGDFGYVNDQGTSLDPTDDVSARRRDNDLHQVDGTTKAVLDLAGDRHLTVSVALFDRDQGLPGPGTLANPQARLGTLRATGILAYESNQDLGLRGRLRATAYGNYAATHFEDLLSQINGSPTDAHDRTVTAGATVDWRRVARPWLVLSGVFDTRFDRFRPSDSIGSMPTGAPATRLFGAVGVESDFWIDPIKFDIIASLRVEAAREETSGRDYFGRFLPTSGVVSHVLPIARLSLVKEVRPWLSLRANGGRYARLPSTIELYGNTGYLQNNPLLEPESGLNADAGPTLSWKRETTGLYWSTNAFASFVSNLIQFRYGNGRARADNLGSARILGVESSATLELGRHGRMVASGTFTDAKDTSAVDAQNGRQLPLRPRYRFYARPEWRRVAVGTQVALGFYADVDATAGNYVDPANTTPVAARLLLGAGVYADLPGNLRLRASGQNLGNAQVHDLAGYPLPGREFYLTLAWSSANNKTKEQPL
jgi:outer membrane cobalamin receptor